MREICTSGSEGGGDHTVSPYPYLEMPEECERLARGHRGVPASVVGSGPIARMVLKRIEI